MKTLPWLSLVPLFFSHSGSMTCATFRPEYQTNNDIQWLETWGFSDASNWHPAHLQTGTWRGSGWKLLRTPKENTWSTASGNVCCFVAKRKSAALYFPFSFPFILTYLKRQNLPGNVTRRGVESVVGSHLFNCYLNVFCAFLLRTAGHLGLTVLTIHSSSSYKERRRASGSVLG